MNDSKTIISALGTFVVAHSLDIKSSLGFYFWQDGSCAQKAEISPRGAGKVGISSPICLLHKYDSRYLR